MENCDGYILTPLPEDEDPIIGNEVDDQENDGGNTVATAEDYVQSLVTIESNWANGKILHIIFCKVIHIMDATILFLPLAIKPR